MKTKGIPELPRLNLPSYSNQQSYQARQSYQQEGSYIYPQSTRNSYQTPYWQSKAQNNNIDEPLSHRQHINQLDDEQHSYLKEKIERRSSQNFNPDEINSARSSSVILESQSQNKQKYYNVGQYQLNDFKRSNDTNSLTFRPSITPQSQSFASSQNNKSQVEGETRTYFYKNKPQSYKKASQSHQQRFYPSEDQQDEFSDQNGSQIMNSDINKDYQQSEYQSRESKRNNHQILPDLEQQQQPNFNKTFLPKTSENYKFFLNSALKDIHGIYSQNAKLGNTNKEKQRYDSTSKASAIQQESSQEPRSRLNSITTQQRYGSQEVSINQHQNNIYIQQLDSLKKRDHSGLKIIKNNELSLPNQNSFSTKYSNQQLIPNKNNQNYRGDDESLQQNSRQYNRGENMELDKQKQQPNYQDFFLDKINLKETNKNHLRKNFHSKRIEELSKPRYQNLKQQYPVEKNKTTGQRSKKQSPIRISPEKISNTQQTQNTEVKQRLKEQGSKDNKETNNSNNNNNSLVKENPSILKSDIKDKNTKASTQNNLDTQQLIDSDFLGLNNNDHNNENENLLDDSFEKLKQRVKKQNELQEQLYQKNNSNGLTSIDKIRFLIGKGKFHFSKIAEPLQLRPDEINQQLDGELKQTKEYFKRQRMAQIKNEKIERILSLNDPQRLESSFTDRNFMIGADQIHLFNHSSEQNSQSQQQFQRLKNINKYTSLSKCKTDKQLKKKKVEVNISYGFKLNKEMEYYNRLKEQREAKEKEEALQKLRQQKEQNSKLIYERERHRQLEVDIVIHQEEIQTKLVFGEKVSFIKIPVVSKAEELDIQYIKKIDQYSTLCTSQKQMKGAQFILRKEKLTDLKQQHYLFHINSLMAKENNLYIKDPIAVRVDSEYYLLQFFKVYKSLKDILHQWNQSTHQSKPTQYSQYSHYNYEVTNQENDYDEVRDQQFFNESQIIHIYKQVLQNVLCMNGVLNIFHSNLNLENIGLFEGNTVSIINYDDTQIIYNKSNLKSHNKNYILSDNNLQRIQYQKYVKYEELPIKEFSPLEYQLHDIICLFIQLKFANPDLMSENQFKQSIKIINLEQPLSSSGQVIKQLIQYQQLQQHNLLDTYTKTLYYDRHAFGMDSLIINKQQNTNNQIDQILFYLTSMQLQKANQIISSLSQENTSESYILKAFLHYLLKQYDQSYEALQQYEIIDSNETKSEQKRIQNNHSQTNRSNDIKLDQNQGNEQIESYQYFWKGRIEFMCKQFDKANLSFEKFINQQNKKCSGLIDLADFYKHIVNLNKSISYYEQAEKYVVNNKELQLYQTYYVQIMKRQIYFYQNTENKEKQIDTINRCIQFLTQVYKDEQDCELYSFKQQFSHLLSQQISLSKNS